MRIAPPLLLVLAAAGAALAAPPEVVTADAVGAALTPSDGRPMLVHFWASWCRPCVVEWPHLAKTLRSLEGRALDIVVVSMDEVEDAPAAAKVLAKVGDFPGKNLLAPPDDVEARLLELDPAWDGTVPTTLLVGKDGKLVVAQYGVTELEPLVQAVDKVAPAVKR